MNGTGCSPRRGRRQDAEADRDHQHPDAVPAAVGSSRSSPATTKDELTKSTRAIVCPGVARGRSWRQRDACGPSAIAPPARRRATGVRQDHAAKNAAIAAPDRSAFGTKPLAPHSPMQRPVIDSVAARGEDRLQVGPPAGEAGRRLRSRRCPAAERRAERGPGWSARAASTALCPVLGFADDLVPFGLEERSRAGPEAGVVVDDQNCHAHSLVRPRPSAEYG